MKAERVGWRGQCFLWAVIAAGGASAFWNCTGHAMRFDPAMMLLVFFSALSAGWKVHLPGMRANLSPNFLFPLQAVLQRNPAEAMVVAWVGALVQTVWRSRLPVEPTRVGFNLGTVTLAVAASFGGRNLVTAPHTSLEFLASSLFAGAGYFVVNTGTVSALMSQLQRRPFVEVWRGSYTWLMPIFAVGALYVGMVTRLDDLIGHGASVILAILAIVFSRLYTMHLERVNLERRRAVADLHHADEVRRVQQRTIEALALAIDAKDAGTGQHIQRVRVYCRVLGRALGLAGEAIEILDTAALLHDVGKLGIPDHILSKPAKLTPEEFEKIKIHPVVGAEILERVDFPMPIVPIVRHHHECWNGTGYPDGLCGENIPLGARILAVVDCFDALTSRRHYREPLSPAGAFGYIRSEAGRRFDPLVVQRLEGVLEEMMISPLPQRAEDPLLAAQPSRNESEPASGWAEESGNAGRPGGCVLSLIGAAGHEATVMVELTSLFAGAKSLAAILPQVEARLRRLVPLEGMLVHRPGPTGLERIYGESRVGIEESGVLSWVWKHQRSVLNARPDTASAAISPIGGTGAVSWSILSVPIRDSVGSAGVLTVTASQMDRFSKDDLRILMSVAEKLCPTIQNLDRMSSMVAESRLDPLTGAPNRRYLRERFDRTVQQAFEEGSALSVMLCDVDRFKQVNDHYGHSTGDRVLQCLAEVLRRECCEGRYYARLGGDEFVLILPGTDTKDWEGLRAELRQKLIECRFDFGLEQVRIEVSMGFAQLSDEQASCERLLDAADQAMYQEKQLRRRQMVSAS